MQELQEEFGDDGLVVLAMSYEDAGKVTPYVAKHGIEVRVAAGANRTKDDYGVRGFPTSVLIDPKGEVTWVGHPMALSKGQVKSALKGAEPASTADVVAYRLDRTLGRPLRSAQEAAAKGDLEKAFTLAAKVRADEKAAKNDREDAGHLTAALDAHVAKLSAQITGLVEDRDALTAVEVLDGLIDALGKAPAATPLRERRDALEQDEIFQRELKAAEAFEDAREVLKKSGFKRAKKRLEKVVKEFPGTRAADRAEGYLKEE